MPEHFAVNSMVFAADSACAGTVGSSSSLWTCTLQGEGRQSEILQCKASLHNIEAPQPQARVLYITFPSYISCGFPQRSVCESLLPAFQFRGTHQPPQARSALVLGTNTDPAELPCSSMSTSFWKCGRPQKEPHKFLKYRQILSKGLLAKSAAAVHHTDNCW